MKNKLILPLQALLRWAGPERFWLYLAILCSLISGLCIMVPYYSLYQVMDALLTGQFSKALLIHTVVLLSVSIIVRFILYGCSVVASHRGAYGALFRVRQMLIEHTAEIPLGALNEYSTGDIKATLNDRIEKLETFLAHQLPDLAYYFAGPIAVFFYLLSVNLPLAMLTLIPLGFALVMMGAMFRGSDQLMGRVMVSMGNLNSILIEYISGMRAIKSFHMGEQAFPKYAQAVEEENAVWNLSSRKMGLPYAAYVVIVESGMLLMVPFGGLFFLNGSISTSVFLLFVFVGSMYLTELRPLQELASGLTQVLGAVSKVQELLAIKPYPKYSGVTGAFPNTYNITLRDVSFSYDGDKKVLQHCNLSIQQGERVGIVGVSGAGKSTILQLVSRFYDVTEGSIQIGGKDIRDIDYDSLLSHISVVFQNTFLTRGTVFENICMGTNATVEQVRKAAQQAQIDEFIMSLPKGYQTPVGNYGSRFSGGEKQRIAIARAILKDAPILLLDEATSAADPEHQLEIDHALDNLCRGKTVLLVAHRLSALKMCDRIAIVENGTITAVGSHEEVLRDNAYYANAWKDYEQARSISFSQKG